MDVKNLISGLQEFASGLAENVTKGAKALKNIILMVAACALLVVALVFQALAGM